MNKLLFSTLSGAMLLPAALIGCAEPAPQPNAPQSVATISTPSKKTCSSDTATGSLVQKRVTCTSDDDSSNDDVQAFHDSINARHGGSAGH